MTGKTRKTELSLSRDRNSNKIRLLGSRILRGCNIHHNTTVIEQNIDLDGFAALSSQSMGPGFTERLTERFISLEIMPTDCFDDAFVQRLHSTRGVPFEEILLEATLTIEAAIAYAMRKTAYQGFGKIQPGKSAETISLVWECIVPRMSIEAGALACLGITELLSGNRSPALHTKPPGPNFHKRLAKLLKAARRRQQSLDAGALAHAAQKRGLPCEVIGASYLALGYGITQQVIHASCAAIGAQQHGTDENLSADADAPIVALVPDRPGPGAAPHSGNGRHNGWMPKRTLHRLLLIDSTLVGALIITPPVLTGDGERTIGQLIDAMNQQTCRLGVRHFPVSADKALDNYLAAQGQTTTSILEKDQSLCLTYITAIESGAHHSDITELVHPDYRTAVLKTLRTRALSTAAIDVLAADITSPVKNGQIDIVRINTNPALWPHVWPGHGASRNVGEHVLNAIYPDNCSGRVPILLVAGQHGTNRVVRATEHMLRNSGRNTALALKKKSFLNGKTVTHDSSLRRNAMRDLLRNYETEILIGTTSFRDIVNQGLGLDHIDVSVILDPEPGQDASEYWAAVGVLIKSTTSLLIVSSRNSIALELMDHIPRNRIILVSHDLRNPYLDLQRQQDGIALIEVRQDEHRFIAILQGSVVVASEQIDAFTTDGNDAAPQSVDHMFSLALAYASGLPVDEGESAATDRLSISLNSAHRMLR